MVATQESTETEFERRDPEIVAKFSHDARGLRSGHAQILDFADCGLARLGAGCVQQVRDTRPGAEDVQDRPWDDLADRLRDGGRRAGQFAARRGRELRICTRAEASHLLLPWRSRADA